MNNDFQQTVNLKEELERQKEEARADIRRGASEEKKTVPRPKPKPKKETKPARKKFIKRSKEIDEVYDGSREKEKTEKELHKITKPAANNTKELLYKWLSLIFGIVIISVVVYFLFFSGNKSQAPVEETAQTSWYRLELINQEVYYGQIDDTGADPVVIKKVYYNYDQLNKEAPAEEGDSNSLKLVKRGKEAYGPDDSMSIVRTQVIKMEPLKEDSKVLKAILDYEK